MQTGRRGEPAGQRGNKASALQAAKHNQHITGSAVNLSVGQHLPSVTHSTRPYQSAVVQSALSPRADKQVLYNCICNLYPMLLCTMQITDGKIIRTSYFNIVQLHPLAVSADSTVPGLSQLPATPSPGSSSTSTNSGSGSGKSTHETNSIIVDPIEQEFIRNNLFVVQVPIL